MVNKKYTKKFSLGGDKILLQGNAKELLNK